MIGWSPTMRRAQASPQATASSRTIEAPCATLAPPDGPAPNVSRLPSRPDLGCANAPIEWKPAARDLVVLLTGAIASRIRGGAGWRRRTSALLHGLRRTIHSACFAD